MILNDKKRYSNLADTPKFPLKKSFFIISVIWRVNLNGSVFGVVCGYSDQHKSDVVFITAIAVHCGYCTVLHSSIIY